MKKNMINKSNILKVCLLVFFASMLPILNASAQKKLYYANSGAPIEVGDSVRINPDSLRYETGERKLKWVYDQVHEIRQVSSKYHPDAVLLRGIYSWIYASSILPENEEKKPHPDPVFTSFEATVDYGMSYTWNDSVYSQTGDYTQKFVAVSGGDSTVTLNLIVLPPKDVYTSFDATVEYGQTYIWNDLTYDSTGVYTQQFQAATGADSVVTLNLTVLPKPLPQSYQVNRLSFGLRGGFASTLQNAGSFPLGFDVALDLRYAHYWSAGTTKPQLGIMTGLGVAYVHTMHHMQLNDDYVLPTIHGDVRYTVNADNVVEKVNEIQLELPVMFSMVTPKGFFLNVGPKLMLPVYSKYRQVIKDPVINAYKEELNGEPITNNIVMGVVSDQQLDTKGKLNNELKLSLKLGAELGYEFKLKNGNSIDLGGYVDCTVFNAYRNQNPASSLITITPPNASSIAIVDVQSMTNSMSKRLGLLDLGLKLSYNFNFKK